MRQVTSSWGLRRAIKKETCKHISECLLSYFEHQGSGVVVNVDNKDVLVKQDGTIYRVSPCRLKDVIKELEEKSDKEREIVQNKRNTEGAVHEGGSLAVSNNNDIVRHKTQEAG